MSSIQDLTTGTGPHLRQAADLAELSVAEFMALPEGTRAYWFGQLAERSAPLWHPADVDPFATFADDGGETVTQLYREHRARQEPVELAQALAAYEQKRQERRRLPEPGSFVYWNDHGRLRGGDVVEVDSTARLVRVLLRAGGDSVWATVEELGLDDGPVQ